jgi:DUF1680 family protein
MRNIHCVKKMGLATMVLLLSLMHTGKVKGQSYLAFKKDPNVKKSPINNIKAYPFPLKDVQVLNGPFLHAMKLDSGYILSLVPNRLLYRFYKNAGLPVKDSIYGGWESDGLSGHTLGHYLSAASMMYATNKNKDFKNKVNYIVAELAKCQEARKTGYVGGIPNEDTLWAKIKRSEIKSSGFDLNGAWSPWYTVHKVMAGLMDAYFYLNNQQALLVATKMADWTYQLVYPLSDSVRLKMLNCEYGGMNEVLANIYAVTGNQKYLIASQLFQDDFVMGKLAHQIDPMPGKHSNTNVPKAIAAARQFELTGSKKDSIIASFFWKSMVQNHSYVIGGNSNYEYCGDPSKLNDRLSDATCETCNTYNMLKLTRHLFSWNPTAQLGDYYERALYNHILASQHSKTGMMTYFMPLRMGTAKQFSDSIHTFTCCVGSGLENHSKYGESIYFEGNDESLYVNLFIPSLLRWERKNTQIIQTTSFPLNNESQITFRTKQPQKFALKIRKPAWSQNQLLITVNGIKVDYKLNEQGFAVLQKTWKDKDVVKIIFDMHLYTETMPDNLNRIAFLYGPIVLAGKLGATIPDPVFGTPVIMDANPISKITKQNANTLEFNWNQIGKPMDVQMAPLYSINDDYYSVYWDKFTTAEWANKEKEYEAEKQRIKEIEQRTIDLFRIGEMQPERDHQLIATEKSYVSDAVGRMGREARLNNNFHFLMKQLPNTPCNLMLTYIGDDKDRVFDILVDDQFLTTVEWKGGMTGHFYDVEYNLPINQQDKPVKITILANHGKTAGRVFGARILKRK